MNYTEFRNSMVVVEPQHSVDDFVRLAELTPTEIQRVIRWGNGLVLGYITMDKMYVKDYDGGIHEQHTFDELTNRAWEIYIDQKQHLQRLDDLLTLQTAQKFIERFYPDFYRSDEIHTDDLLYQYLHDDIGDWDGIETEGIPEEDAALNWLNDRLSYTQEDLDNNQVHLDYYKGRCKILSKAIMAYTQKQDHDVYEAFRVVAEQLENDHEGVSAEELMEQFKAELNEEV